MRCFACSLPAKIALVGCLALCGAFTPIAAANTKLA